MKKQKFPNKMFFLVKKIFLDQKNYFLNFCSNSTTDRFASFYQQFTQLPVLPNWPPYFRWRWKIFSYFSEKDLFVLYRKWDPILFLVQNGLKGSVRWVNTDLIWTLIPCILLEVFEKCQNEVVQLHFWIFH